MWNEYHIFATAAETLSFSQAASRLGLQASSVSRAVSRLETHLGVRLFERSARGLYLTEAGKRFHTSISVHLDGVLAAQRELIQANGRASGTVRIAAPHEVITDHVIPVISQMLAQGLDVRFEVEATARLPDPIADHVDVFISHRRNDVSDQSLIGSLLFNVAMGVFAAPALVDRLGPPHKPADLASWPCLIGLGERVWKFSDRAGQTHEITPQGPIAATPSILRIEMAVSGHGVVLASLGLCTEHVRNGRLVRLLENFDAPERVLWAFVPSRRLPPRASKIFLSYLAEQMRRSGYRGR